MGMRKSAEISACGKYRYHLRREWDLDLPRVAFIMLNPSTADDKKDDPTIRRCIEFAKAWGYGGIDVVNLFAYRATNPKELKKASNPIGPDNDGNLLAVANMADKVICAWGTNGEMFGRSWRVIEKLRKEGVTPLCLDKTKKGHPKHPLYLKGDVTPKPM